MVLRVLSREATMRALELAQKPYRPRVIVELKEAIEAKMRIAEFRESITEVIDQQLVDEIVAMKLKLDALYGDWAEGKIQ